MKIAELGQCCIGMGGDGFDNSLRFLVGHHPSCEEFLIFIPTYTYKINLYKITEFLMSSMQLEAEKALESAIKVIEILEQTEGKGSYGGV
jgi:hypothetical protein